MSRVKAAILLILISIIGSFEVFYASNMIFSDVGNACQGLSDIYFIASVPALMVAMDFVLGAIYVARRVARPESVYSLNRLYSLLLGIFSLIGTAASVLSGTAVYRSFIKPYPFPYYVIIALVVNVLLMVLGIVLFIRNKKHNIPGKREKITIVYVLHTIMLALIVFFAFNRFGALLWAPVYVQVRTLYMTFPFYIWLLIPIAFLAHAVFYVLGIFRERRTVGMVNAIVLMVVNIGLGGATFALGTANTQFISAISPALALERLATMPIDSIIQYAGALFLGTYMLVVSIRYRSGREIRL